MLHDEPLSLSSLVGGKSVPFPPFCFGNLFYSVRLLLLPANRKSCAIARAIFKLSSYTWIVYRTMRLLVVFSPRYILPVPHARLPASSRRHAWRKRAKGGGLTNKVERGKESHVLSLSISLFPLFIPENTVWLVFRPVISSHHHGATSQTVFYFLSPTAICLVGLFRLLLVFIQHTS